MLTPIQWIRAYVPDLNTDPQEFVDKMTLSGSKVETYEELNKTFDKVVVGRIEKIEAHPDADKLVVCRVNVGEETLQIVTGAPNVFEGAVIPVVLVGGYVSDGQGGIVKIKKGKLRGVESYGMMCSVQELGQSHEGFPEAPENGVYIFNENEAEIGQDAGEALGLNDCVVEYEITSNRVDCFSIYGLAREVAATWRLPLKPLEIRETGNDENVDDFAEVEVKNTDLCKRYCARVVKNIRIAPSPAWLRHRLHAVGIRPINNIVDITNYVMEEMGQPMHAFDLDRIAGHKIIVNTAKTDTFTTLDGQERKLDESILMINDAEGPVAIAGIMGGENSKITDDVKTMLFESACFDGTNVRLSSKKIGLRTDSSTKFEKGLDPNNCLDAVNRACELIEMLDAGDVVGGVIDVHGEMPVPREVPFDLDACNRLLGTDLDADTVDGYFRALELDWQQERGVVIVPTWRQDLERLADLTEEVARFYGYDKIPVSLPKMAAPGGYSHKMIVQNRMAEILSANGYNETMTYSFEGPGVFDKLLLEEDDSRRQAIRIANPLGEEYSIMRTLPYHGMLTSLSTNYNNRNKSVRLYEFANTYLPKALPLTELPDEKIKLTLGMFDAGDFYQIKGVVEAVMRGSGLRGKIRYERAKAPYLHPGRSAVIFYEGTEIGEIGELHPEVAERYDIGTRAYIASVDFDSLSENARFDHKYVHVAKFPSVSRDLCFVMDVKDSVILIEDAIERCGGKFLESYRLFDLYEGERLGAGLKSAAYNMKFRAEDRTLTEEDVQPVLKAVIDELQKQGIELRK